MSNIEKISTINMTREEWLEERRKSLGGSDMGAILGINKFSSPYKVWAEKTGKLPPAPDNEAMRQGRDLEDYVASRFEEVSGKKCRRVNAILRNGKYPFLHANIDRDICGKESGLECKTASALNLKSFSGGEFPESYYAQCVTYLAVTEYKRWYLAVLILGKEFKVYQMTTVPDDECPAWCETSIYVSPEEISALISAAADFWRLVETETPPPVDGFDATSDVLNQIYSPSVEDTAPVELFGRKALLDEYMSLDAQGKQIDARKEQIKQTIMSDMQQAPEAYCDAYKITWKTQSPRKTFDYKSYFKNNPAAPDNSAYFKTSAPVRPFKIKLMEE